MPGQRVIVGVSGSIAAYKAAELVRLLVGQGVEVVPLLSEGAQRFLGDDLLAGLARRRPDELYPHLERADLLVVAPASANMLAKLALGLAGDVVAEAALAHPGPLLIAPAMSPRMWSHPAVQANLQTLVARGALVVGPATGESAEGEVGVGRLAAPAEIAAAVKAALAPGPPGPLAGRRVLVSAGGTREPLDDVRFVGNRASGRMGVALAAAAQERGARVTLLAANLAVPAPGGVTVVSTPSSAALLAAAEQAEFDVYLGAAAVADYRPQDPLAGKRAKDEASWTVTLVPTVDVLATLGQGKRLGQLLVGFAVGHGEEDRARKRLMLAAKQLDLVVYNDLADQPFDGEESAVTLIGADGERRLERRPKQAIAEAVLDEVGRLLS